VKQNSHTAVTCSLAVRVGWLLVPLCVCEVGRIGDFLRRFKKVCCAELYVGFANFALY